MKHLARPTVLLALAVAIARPPCLPAESSPLENRLDRALKLFPDADTDKDGKLSMEEALKYLESHPELKELLAGKAKGGSDAQRVSSSGPKAQPATDTAGLHAGPRVFVCAHSFMIYTASLLPPLAKAAGIAHQDAGRQMIGGSRVLQHWNIPDEKNRAKSALRDGTVDVLTLSPHLLLPDEGIDNFAKLGLEKNPKLRVLVQASWPARDGNAGKDFVNENRNDSTVESLRKMSEAHHSAWLQSLEKQVRDLNASIGHQAVFIVPVCEAVFALRERIAEGNAPGLPKQTDLFRDNLGHPKPPLAALVTYCHFANIYERSPVGLPVPAELKDIPQAGELNRLLQELAWNAVTQYPMSGVKAESKAAASAVGASHP